MYRIDRKEFIQEIMLREHISKSLRSKITEARSSEVKNKVALRKVISNLIKEAEEADKAPHRSTGINVLADVLKKIVPVIEQDYKALTTDPTQRESFRAHIINAAQNAIAPVSASSTADGEEGVEDVGEPELTDDEVSELEEIEVAMGDGEEDVIADAGLEDGEDEQDMSADVDGDLDLDADLGDEAFIDINDAEPEEEDMFGIAGKDDTGRNFAQATFDKIEKQIVDAYALLGNDEDKELFYSYLVTNLKLYFDKFEDELASVLPEPTTPEYEEEKDQQDEEPESAEDELDLGDEEEELEL
tara:strand:- start:1409 stop:2314 length:906 start_codon:yes stop_codon:yes gene_type:complete